MSTGPTRFGAALAGVIRPLARAAVGVVGRRSGLARRSDPAWRDLLTRMRRDLEAGPVHVIGLTTGTHDSGVALVEASSDGVVLLANVEEERLSRRRYETRFPEGALAEVRALLQDRGVDPAAAFVVGSWDWLGFAEAWAGFLAERVPGSLRPQPTDLLDVGAVRTAAARVATALGRPVRPLVGLPHHANHAIGSYLLSPWARDDAPVLVLVADGAGDDGSLAAWVGRSGRLDDLGHREGFFDSLGLMYQAIAVGQGGWTPLSAEGRFMGAAAWGDRDRATNPVYPALRRLVHLEDGGRVCLERAAAGWHDDARRPYRGFLAEALGAPVPPEARWNPDAVLDPQALDVRPVTAERLDQAAALQLVLEDAVGHVVQHLLARTGARRLVWTGGVALNCVASLYLLERFEGLELWVPPFPGDAGVAAGAALRAVHEAAPELPVAPLRHAFLGGRVYTTDEIRGATAASGRPWQAWDDAADRLARQVAYGAIVGLFQGAAETGPRALGHRSILADPRSDARARINARVKRREAVRPVAPMATLEAARALFVLPAGLAHHDHAALDYMVQCVRAGPEAVARVPAVVHRDGTARLQIVRPEDPFTHAFLQAMGRHAGVELAVNTSLNVGEPIAHTPADALRTLDRAPGLDGILFVGSDGAATWVAGGVPGGVRPGARPG